MSLNLIINLWLYSGFLNATGEYLNVWLVGSSIIKQAFIDARISPGRVHLGLERVGMRLWWQARSGLTLDRLRNLVGIIWRCTYIHIDSSGGGNDIRRICLRDLRKKYKDEIDWVEKKLPNCIIIFLPILSRINWRYAKNVGSMEKWRLWFNNAVASYVLRNGGCYVRYPDVKAKSAHLEDGCN